MLSRTIRVVAWFPGPLEVTEHYFQWLHRLNQELDTSHWQIYEHKEEPNGVLLALSTDTMFITVLKRMGWRPFSSMGQVIFSLLSAEPEGNK